jgi:ABC-type branched-subunit amino acid transport system substrate-binding protein
MQKRLTLIGVAAAIAVLATAAGASARSDASAQPIKLMAIAPVATPIQNYPDAFAGAQAAADAINRRGGIKGRKIELLTCNTQSNANVAVGCARKAVDEKVAAVVGHISTLSTLELPVLSGAGIPSVGIATFGNAIDWTNSYSFPFVGGATAAYISLPFALKKLGKKRFVIVYQDVPSAATNAKLAKNAAQIARLPVAGSFVLPGATTDFAPYAQRLRELQPDAVMFINSPGVSGGLIRAATTFGVRPLWVHNTATIGEPEAAQIGSPAEGMLLAGILPSFRDTQLPAIRRFVAEMRAAGKADDEVNLKPSGVNGWLSVYAVAEAAKWVKGDVTSASLVRALRAQKKPVNLQGLVTWKPGAKGPAAFPRWSSIKQYFLTVKGGKIVSWGNQLPPLEPMRAMKYVR